MISLKPFRAVRPTRDKAYLVATRSYLTYAPEILENKLKHNPYTFLHIINPAGGMKLKPGKARYRKVREAYEQFLEEGILMRDESPAYYIYRQVKEGNEYIGIVAGVSVKDYQEGRIKKHEKTLTARERMFTDYLEFTGFNAEPVLLTYSEDLQINQLFARYIEKRAEYEFTSTDRVLHQLWPVSAKDDCRKITETFERKEALYIADGHHRCSSSALLSRRISEKHAGKEAGQHDYFMAFLIGEDHLRVYDFNRLVKLDQPVPRTDLLSALRENFLVEVQQGQAYRPEKRHEISMYFGKKWYKLVPKTGSFDPQDPVDQLDAELLNRFILKPLFHIKNLKTDKRVDFLPGTEGMLGLKNKVDSGEYDLAFALFPVSVDQIRQVADAGMTMPPKTTYIEPKLRSGLTIYSLFD
jgi:uncharacterized protein (DUF1015 family)